MNPNPTHLPSSQPRLLAWRVLERITTERDREGLLGDLLEEYEDLRQRSGQPEADRWLAWQALHSLLPVLQRRASRAVSQVLLARGSVQLQPVSEGANMFERSLLSISEGQTAPRRWWPVHAAIGLHLFLLFCFAVVQAWSIEELQAPVVQDTYIPLYMPAPPPPAPGPRTSVRPRHPGVAKAVKPRIQPQQPVFVPNAVPQPILDAPEIALDDVSLPDDLFSDTDGLVGDGGEGGPSNGVIGGIECTTNCGNAGGIEGGFGSELPIAVAGSVQKPELMKKFDPRYTECARRARIQGVVIVEAIIDRQGSVTGARVLRGLGCGLSEEALRAVEQWKFKPATLNNRPVTVYFSVTVKFSLK